jgi:hypothetical protein
MCSPDRCRALSCADAPGAPAGHLAGVTMGAGGLIIGFTVLSAFTATRVYLSEQFPTALRGRGHIFGVSFGRLFAEGLAPFLMEPHTGSATISSVRFWSSSQSAPSSPGVRP